MPLVQGAQGKAGMLKTMAVLSASMALVTAIWGGLIAAVGGTIAQRVGSTSFMDAAMRLVLPSMGLVMLIIALGELGLIRRLLPDLPHELTRTAEQRVRTAGHYREVAVLGLGIAATFGIFCTRPTYLALIVYVAATGSVAYGSLALGAYGVGMALSIALTALGLLQASRSERLVRWLAERREAIHLVQGLAFAFLGAVPIWFFWASQVLSPN
jgi:cytochrome c biogenesis protein CcdA